MKTYMKVIHYYESIYDKFLYILNNFKYTIFRECRRGNLYIANVATSKEARGLGVGKLLMKYAEETAKNQEFKGVSLIAKNEYVSTFYEKLKYRKVFDRSILGERLIKMAKPI
ncbi:Acetyltransferase (GNAT) family protein [Clostridium frigidicarnis]|uniref:Acetyltransferase (GNAT) family protein n=2 Tax=Clostridium frigidicarnis TaxID=84698 RepID=A0A1I0YYS9_9CLOT|nr:Acetyltransferase (GNAT) family protein [Clostridium frigidicarnis]